MPEICKNCEFFQFGDCIADPEKVTCEFMEDPILNIKMLTEPMGSLKFSEPIEVCDDCPDSNCGKCIEDEGMKFDDDKLMWDLLPWDAVEQIVEIMTYGAKKYKPNNWQKVSEHRYHGALMRHLVAEFKGEDKDVESGFLHLAHAACNILFLLCKKMNEVKNND